MRVWTVHEKRDPASPVLVPEAFSRGALILGPFWLLARGLWLEALANAVLIAGCAALPGQAGWLAAAALQLLIGLHAQDLRRWRLARRGWSCSGVVAAPDADGALQRALA